MLRDLKPLADRIRTHFKDVNNWPEVKITPAIKTDLEKLDFFESIDSHSMRVNTPTNHTILPGQYLLYAALVKELAMELIQYTDVIENLKNEKKSTPEIIDLIMSSSKPPLEMDEFSKSIALKPFRNGSDRVNGKDLVNGSSLRSPEDFFSSVILKVINVPDASSGILGDFIYALAKNPTVYSAIEKEFHPSEYVLVSDQIRTFVRDVLLYFRLYDDLNSLKSCLKLGGSGENASLELGEIKLTSIFKVSDTLLTENDLTSGNTLRWYSDPVLFHQDKFYYLSTQWVNDGQKSLQLEKFNDLIKEKYPDFETSENNNQFYLKFAGPIGSRPKAIPVPFSAQKFVSAINSSMLQFDEQLIVRFLGSLMSKPFVLLTGLTGSGKTKLAQAFASWICENEDEQVCMVPVGADWTNREPLLGYPNALESGEYVKPETKVIDLLVRASVHEYEPHFLILDEMNLSHVERYFADFLSVMESEKKIPLHRGPDSWGDVPYAICLPKNLFIIGTVNVDETTYMFSPKVLDRANVIDFRVAALEMEAFLKNPAKPILTALKSYGSGMAASFVCMAKEKTPSFTREGEMNTVLLSFFNELKKTGAEFGYRTASEIHRLAGMLYHLTDIDGNVWEIDVIIDTAIIQKLLPKVHGSRSKLEPVLTALAKLCLSDGVSDIPKLLQSFEELPDKIEPSDQVKFKRSLEKILRMKARVTKDGFTSFAEA
jgi:hypothetical protein